MRKSVTAMSTAPRLGFDLNQEEVLQEVGYKSSAGSIMQAFLLSSISDDDIQSFRRVLGLNPLHIAAWTGNVKIIQDQLANGLNCPADASAQTEGGFTPLHLAASRGHADVIEFLLSVEGVDGKAVSQEGFIALHFAASVGHCESVKLLLQKCADAVNSKDYMFGRTALHFAALGGHATVAELVASRPADVTSQTAGGFTPLHLASSRGHADVVKFLVSLQGIDGKAISSEGFTALQLAAYGGHYESVRLLLERCADVVNSVDKVFGRTALHFAALGGGHTRDNYKFDRHAYAAIVELLATVPGFTISPKDRVRDLSPLLLAAMQPKHWCNLSVIEKLLQLDANHKHINEKVGDLEVSIDDPVVAQFLSEEWRELTRIEIDNSMKLIPGVSEAVDLWECDLYRKCAIRMEGHSALHLASTQDNTELVEQLVKCVGIQLNEGDTALGMTPLHCAIRTGAVGACAVLLSVKEVNVNAKLARSGRCRRGMWYAEGMFWKAENYRLFLLQEHDTPLHMAFRTCEGEDIRKIVIDLCNLSYFNGAALNASGETAFELAESRLGMCAPVPSIFTSRRKLPKLLHKNQYTDSRNLADALAFLSCHPSTSAYMTFVNDKKKISDDSVNAFLVTATLLAGITFAAYLQPPFGTAFGDYRSRAVKLFWTFNSLSFYFSVYTILRCLLTIMRSDQIVLVDREEYFQLVRMEHAVPLILSVALGIGAFVAAGYGNLPPESKGLMVACTVSGLLLVLFQAFRNVYVCIRLCLNPPVDEDTGFVESIFPLVVIFSGPVTIPVLVVCRYLIWKMRCVGDHDYCNFLLRSAFVGVHFVLAVAVTLYALITAQ